MSVRWNAIGRGIAGRCGHCGAGGLFASYFQMREHCPGCGLAFEREEGYWLGAMVVNIGLTEALFGIWFVGGMVATWPEVPWTLLLVGGVLLNLTVPIAYYPWSKTAWVGLHLAFVRPEPSEEATAIAALDQQRRAAAIAARDARLAADRDAPPAGGAGGAREGEPADGDRGE